MDIFKENLRKLIFKNVYDDEEAQIVLDRLYNAVLQIHSDNQSKYQSHVDQKTKYDQDNADRIHAEQEENQQAITDRIQKDLSKQSPEQDKKFWEFWKKACLELDFNLE